MKCIECDNELESHENKGTIKNPMCETCQAAISNNVSINSGTNVPHIMAKNNSTRQTIVVMIGAIVVLIILAGNFHIVTGSSINFRIIRKASFSFDETFVNLDKITNMPLIFAKSQYPLSIKALQDAGILETDVQFEERSQQKVQQELEKAQELYQNLLNNSNE